MKIIDIRRKVKDTSGSSNFIIAMISVFILSFEANGFTIGATPEEFYANIADKNWTGLAAMVFANFFNIVLKIVKEGEKWSLKYAWKNSNNFKVQAVATVLALVTWIVGVTFGADAPEAIASALNNGSFLAIATALIVHVVNVFVEFFSVKDYEIDVPDELLNAA